MRVLKWLGIGFGVLAIALFLTVTYLKSSAQARYAKKHDVKVAGVPIPFPLSDGELAELRKPLGETHVGSARAGDEVAPSEAAREAAPAGVDLDKLAHER